MNKRDILLQVKEMVDKYGDDVITIAHKMGMDVETVRQWVEVAINLWS